jgi:Tir chaperone protein (CesT) family
MREQFAALIRELGEIMLLPLELDANEACFLIIDDVFPIQLEYDIDSDSCLIVSFVGELPAGKYREMVLEGGLLENIQNPAFGIFSYIRERNELTIYKSLPMSNLNAESLAGFLGDYIERGMEWQRAIRNGNPLPRVAKPIPKKK